MVKTKIIQKILVLSFIFVYFLSNTYCSIYLYNIEKKQADNKKLNQTNDSSVSTMVSSPVFEFQSKSQVLMEPSTGKVLYSNNENEKIYPASVTKIMTLLLIMENIDCGKIKYTDKVTCSLNASRMGGSQIWFKEGEQLTIDEALKAICVVSANDVTLAMAEMIGGNELNFVKMMNDKAADLGMKGTNFVNCHGIDDDNHYTTAIDIAIMSRELIIKHPSILKYTSIWMDSLRNGTFGLSSTNKLIRYYEGATGLKTGSTSKALFSLSATATRDNTTFISVVCTAPSSDIRLNETKQLLDYGFNNYSVTKIFNTNDVVNKVKIDKNIKEFFNATVDQDVNILIEKGTKVDYTIDYIINNLKAPVSKNTEVGKVVVKDKNNNILVEKPMYINEDVEKTNIIQYFKYILKKIVTI
jgi:serine-type D-Ala-D-Ala carboxypeptidase (penicillin-binding protein 5/6)